jgi:hypothetical protein
VGRTGVISSLPQSEQVVVSLKERILDALDVETFIVCQSEEEGKGIMLAVLEEIGFKDIDIVFTQFAGMGVRIRARAYLYRPGDQYRWLDGAGGEVH